MSNGAIAYSENEEATLQERLAEIDATIEQYKEMVEFGEALKRLEDNEDYKAVFSVGYFEAEAERITGLITGEDPLRRDSMENIIEAALSIRNVKQYLKYKRLDAQHAPSAIEDNLRLRKQITAEAAEDAEYDAEYASEE
jgi:hypothetical protein